MAVYLTITSFVVDAEVRYDKDTSIETIGLEPTSGNIQYMEDGNETLLESNFSAAFITSFCCGLV